MWKNMGMLGLGALIGVAGFYVGQTVTPAVPEQAARPARGADPGASEGFDRRMTSLEKAIGDLNRTLDLALAAGLSNERPEPTDQADRGSHEQALPVTRRAAATSVPEPELPPWTGLVHRSLATVLVEHGQTPYDEGVDRILPGAAREVREAAAELEQQMQELEGRYPEMKTTADPRYREFEQARNEIHAAHEVALAAIVESFRTRVAALDR